MSAAVVSPGALNPGEEQPVLVEVVNHVGHLTLNRPAGLNTLTLPMVRTLHQQLQAWADDPQVHAVVLRAVGDKAFCAGGDIRAIYDSVRNGDDLHRTFFDEEYALNQYMHGYAKPLVALLHGIVLGGGMGVAQPARVRLVTETARIGMPETSIGFFPDVGAGYFLSRLPGELGTYLGVTGNHINAADSLYCGLADAYIASAEIPALDRALASVSWGDHPAGELQELLAWLTAKTLPDASLAALRPAIDEHFGKNSVAEIRQSLAAEERPEYRDWAQKTVQILDSRSPMSMAVSLEHLRRGKTLSIEECFDQERRLTARLLEQGDFLEGIRALIVDKDKNPQWNPPGLDQVKPDQVAQFFRQD